MQRVDGHIHQNCGAVGIGYDTRMLSRSVGVDLWNHERNRWVHPKGAGVVDHHCACVHNPICPGLGGRAASRGQHNVDIVERAIAHRFYDQRLPLKGERLPS